MVEDIYVSVSLQYNRPKHSRLAKCLMAVFSTFAGLPLVTPRFPSHYFASSTWYFIASKFIARQLLLGTKLEPRRTLSALIVQSQIKSYGRIFNISDIATICRARPRPVFWGVSGCFPEGPKPSPDPHLDRILRREWGLQRGDGRNAPKKHEVKKINIVTHCTVKRRSRNQTLNVTQLLFLGQIWACMLGKSAQPSTQTSCHRQ